MEILGLLLDQVSEFKPGIRFVGWGEPLLHPKIEDLIKLVKSRDSLLFVSTNGLLLNEKNINFILDGNVDTVRVSFQGVTKEGYSFMRNNDRYDDVVSGISHLMDKRNEGAYDTFVILNTTVTDESEEEISNFREYWDNLVDKVEVGKTTFSQIDDVEHIKKLKLIKREKIERIYTPCIDVRMKIQVNWDGTVPVCCSDHSNELLLGSINDKSLIDLWNGDKMNGIRELIGDRLEHYKLPVCKNCYSEEHKFDYLKKMESR